MCVCVGGGGGGGGGGGQCDIRFAVDARGAAGPLACSPLRSRSMEPPPSIDPSAFDLVVIGTGLTESIVAA